MITIRVILDQVVMMKNLVVWDFNPEEKFFLIVAKTVSFEAKLIDIEELIKLINNLKINMAIREDVA